MTLSRLGAFAIAFGLAGCVATETPSSSSSSSEQPAPISSSAPSSQPAVSSVSSQDTSSAPESSSSVSSQPAATAFERGRELYFKTLGSAGTCASCHGDTGEGVFGKGGALFGEECSDCGTPSALIARIDATMPAGNKDLCVDDCANDIAVFIFEQFNDKDFAINCDEGIQKASPMRRLNKVEFTNVVRDLFNTGQGKMTAALPDEQELVGGFATVGSALTTSFDWTASLLDGATEAALKVVADGAFPRCEDGAVALVDSQPKLGECSTTAQCRGLYDGATDCANSEGGVCYCGDNYCAPTGSNTPSPAACFASDTKRVAKLLFRRDMTNAEFTRIDNIAKSVTQKTGSQSDGHSAALVALLTSPKAIYSLPADSKETIRPLTQAELADRLALTLWGSIPDETLIDLANSGELKGAVLETQIDRMLADSRFNRFASVFGDAWIGLGGYNLEGEDLGITNAQFAELLADMKTETRLFIAHIIKNNLPINTLYTANYSFLNARLQAHYGFSVTTDNASFIKTDFPVGSARRGLLTQAAILAKAFDGTKTSVVKRGVLPLEAFTCTAPEAPTDNPDIADAINMQGASNDSEKDKMAARAANSACASCHATIDPIGWVFTEFGPAGEPVNTDPDGDPLDTQGILNGQAFDNAHGMVDVLVDQGHFESCFANKFLIHAIGRKVSYHKSVEDQCAIDQALNATRVNGETRARDLIKSLLQSDIATVSGNVEAL